MKIIVGSDHRGCLLKNTVRDALKALGHEVADIGADDPTRRVDYTDYAFKVARRTAGREYDRGVLVCSSGIGMSIAANRVRGARAALCRTEDDARLSRSHNNANILCLGQDSVEPDTALKMLKIWLETPFDGGRHVRRVEKLDEE